MNLLIIGTGSIGERHLRCFQQLGRCETIGICEPREGQRLRIAEQYGVPGDLAFGELEEAIDSGRFEAAVIAAPAPTHVPLGQRLTELGFHLLIEKPLSLSLEGVSRLEETVAAQGTVVAVGYVHRAHPAVEALKAAIEAGRAGRLLQLRLVSGQAFATLRPAYREVYFARPEMGGGAITDMMTHLYHVGDWLAGPIERLVTDASHLQLEGVTVEDTVHSLTRQADGVMGSYALNLYQHPNEVEIVVVGEEGTLKAEYAKKRWSWMTEPNGRWNHEAIEMPEIDVMYRRQNAAFLDAIEGRGSVCCSLADSIRTLEVNLASHRSVTEVRWIDLRKPE